MTRIRLVSLLLGSMASVVTPQPAQAENPVLAWTDLMLDAIRTDNTGPTLSTRNLAILHLATYDAVNSVGRRHQPYQFAVDTSPDTSMEAAAAAAGYRVLVVLYPGFTAQAGMLYTNLIATLPPDDSTTRGLALGEQVAVMMLQSRADDGSTTTVPYIPSDEPGAWMRTPPHFRPPLDPHWRYVRLFGLEQVEPFVAPGPPALTSPEYARDFEEVRLWGGSESSLRTEEQALTAVFWSDFSYTAMPPGHWHEIALGIARDRANTLEECARLLALLSLAEADSAIVCWEGKYRHNFWRPITAIQRADEDGNAATTQDPTWDHLLPAPNFPEYPSGHSTFSKAGAQTLALYYGTDQITFTAWSDSVPGVSRTFHSLAACADEVGQSRIYGGFHFQFANRDGKESGRKIAEVLFANYLLPTDQLPQLHLEMTSTEGPRLRLHGWPGQLHVIEASTDLVHWMQVTNLTAASGGVPWTDPEMPTLPERFYRARSSAPRPRRGLKSSSCGSRTKS